MREIELYGGPFDGLRMRIGDDCWMVHVPDSPDSPVLYHYGRFEDPHRFVYGGAFIFTESEQEEVG